MRKAISDSVEEILQNPAKVYSFAGQPQFTSNNVSCGVELGIFFWYARLEIEGELVKTTHKEEAALNKALYNALEYNKLCNLVRLQKDL